VLLDWAVACLVLLNTISHCEANMAGGYTEADIIKFQQRAATGKLSTRDRKLINSVKLSEEEMLADMRHNISEANMKELEDAIRNAPSPQVKSLLMGEQENLLAIIRNEAAQKAAKTVDVPTILDKIKNVITNLWGSKE